ncbi:hypothetical protein [Lapillicoccus sp.]|uniref:hypothetical protein n=1 Tax=Lapillicoccus sp. TaxID=1909287 RepID=UPI0039834A0E
MFVKLIMGDDSGAGTFVDWGFLHVSVANIAVIGAMLALFVLALVVPFPGHHRTGRGDPR